MSEPFIGEVHIFGFNFPPKGYASCDGQLLQIRQNQALFSVLGTTYGGDGTTTFALPDLRGCAALHVGPGFTQGQRGGEEAHTLIATEMPQHTHALVAEPNNATTASPAGAVLAATASTYGGADSLTPLHAATVAAAGSSQPHPNMQPFVVLNFCIALAGVFPSRD